MLDRFDCYELCVQSPRHLSVFLRAVHGHAPIVLREDFCGTAGLSRRWVVDGTESGDRAVAVDLDEEVVEWAAARAEGQLSLAERGRLRLVVGDCTRADLPNPPRPRGASAAPPARSGGVNGGADVVFVGNFSIGYLHTRAELLSYLRLSHARLAQGSSGLGGGVLVVDIYGGSSAFKCGGLVRKHPGPRGETIHYNWVREEADPLTGMVVNSISFRVEKDGEVVAEWPRAFVYRWRHWSIAELREAMMEVGFARTSVYTDINVAPGHPAVAVKGAGELEENWIVLVAAWA